MRTIKKSVLLNAAIPAVIMMLALFVTLFSTGCGKDCEIICDRGYQDNCQCVCPDGWEGSRCQEEIEPSKIIIKKILVTKMPEFKDPNSNPPTLWDNTGLPDLMLRIWREKTATSEQDFVVLFEEDKFGGTQLNFNPFSQATFICSGCTLSLPIRGHRISLYNDNNPIGYGAEDNLMGGINFTPYTAGQGFPNPIILSNSKVTFEITVEYQWP